MTEEPNFPFSKAQSEAPSTAAFPLAQENYADNPSDSEADARHSSADARSSDSNASYRNVGMGNPDSNASYSEASTAVAAEKAEHAYNTNKMLIIALIICATVTVLFATLFFTSRAHHDANAGQTQSSQSQQAEQPQQNGESQAGNSAQQNGDATAADATKDTPQEVPQDVKEVIDAQHRLDPNDPMAKGDLNAPVVIEIYADFRCGHCMNYSLQTEPQLAQRIAQGEVRYEFNNLPVLGADSTLAAQAAQAAAKQNKFWEYHDQLFKFAASGSAEYTDATLIDLATQAGVPNLQQFSSDLHSAETVQTVASAVQRAQELGITGVPALLVGYSYVPGEIEIDQLNQLIDTELLRTK